MTKKTKKMTSDEVARFSHELILRGDVGDGVPNFLSPDDVFVSGGRQKPLTKTRVESLMAAGRVGCRAHMSDEEKRNLDRNEMMIDLSMVPGEIADSIVEAYEAQGGKGRSKIFNYMFNNGLNNLMQHMQEF